MISRLSNHRHGGIMYRFPLEPVLNHQKFKEDTVKQELSKLEEAVFAARIEADRISRQREKYERLLRDKEKGGLEAATARVYLSFVDHLAGEINAQKERIKRMESECRAIRDRLLDIMKRREMLESLEEKGHISYEREEMKEEQTFLNELAIGRFIRAS